MAGCEKKLMCRRKNDRRKNVLHRTNSAQSAQVQPYLAPPAQKAVNGSVRRKKLCVGEKTTGVRMSCTGLTVRCSAQVQPYLAPPAQKAMNGRMRRKKLCVGDMTTGVSKACAGLQRRRSRSRFTANETAKSRLRNPAAP